MRFLSLASVLLSVVSMGSFIDAAPGPWTCMTGCLYPLRLNDGVLECMDDGAGGCVRMPCMMTCRNLVESVLVPAIVPVTTTKYKNLQCGQLDPMTEMLRLVDHPSRFAWQQGNPETLPPSSSGVPYPDVSRNELYNAILFQTNVIRKVYGLKAVSWDLPAQKDLDAWAATCPGRIHGGPKTWGNMAQNLAILNASGCKSVNTCKAMDTPGYLWFQQEEPLWNYRSSSCSKSWEDCGHFSNMMGENVKYMACGSAVCPFENRMMTYVWCNYKNPTHELTLTRPADFDKIKFLVHM